jgi:protein SCO1/2
LFSRPAAWAAIPVGLLLGATAAFALFQPVKVVPRVALGPTFELADQEGQPFTDQTYAGRITLYGFGYLADPTGALDQTLGDMQAFQGRARADGLAGDTALALILFDERRDTVAARQALALERGLDLDNWSLVSGGAQTLKRVIGQGFGIYYEAVPLADLPGGPYGADRAGEYGYLQAQRYVLIDERNLIRAEYRAPLDLEIVMRDVRLILRERDSVGAARTLNEAAHLFLCYPK